MSGGAAAQSVRRDSRLTELDVAVGLADVRGDAFRTATHASFAIALSRRVTRYLAVAGATSVIAFGGGSDGCELRADGSGACRRRLPGQAQLSTMGSAIIPMRQVETRLAVGPSLALGGTKPMLGGVGRVDVALGRGAVALLMSQQFAAFRAEQSADLRVSSLTVGLRVRLR
jgi:hypothetical protein